ncbi:hypothetical protein DPMN_060464 [Dreissena polymorpha]|uniref:Uncharacterized protein n=1 Tax=Dreissena polymorpha TaxID=45954 RepID=A0A9D4C5T4_DREPO|nr:hypothetical protein DPMN_060464 [Dreissena polymorpha]
MCSILEAILKSDIDIDNVSVCVRLDIQTSTHPHKMVVMNKETAFTRPWKHSNISERQKSPVYIGNVVGGKLDDPSQAIIVTKEENEAYTILARRLLRVSVQRLHPKTRTTNEGLLRSGSKYCFNHNHVEGRTSRLYFSRHCIRNSGL